MFCFIFLLGPGALKNEWVFLLALLDKKFLLPLSVQLTNIYLFLQGTPRWTMQFLQVINFKFYANLWADSNEELTRYCTQETEDLTCSDLRSVMQWLSEHIALTIKLALIVSTLVLSKLILPVLLVVCMNDTNTHVAFNCTLLY